MPREGNRRGVATPLDMVIFEGDEYTVPRWDLLNPHKDWLWTLKQCNKYITGSHITRLWYCDDMDAIQDWLAHWEFRMTTCAISELALWYTEVIWWTKGTRIFPHVLIATSQWCMRRWCLRSVWINPEWQHKPFSHHYIKQLTFPKMLIGTGGSCTMS